MTAATLEHDENGPFVRSSWAATAEGQTETVYAIEVIRRGGKTQYYNARSRPFTADEFTETRNGLYRWMKDEGPIMSCELVSRQVTVSATPWAALPSTDK